MASQHIEITGNANRLQSQLRSAIDSVISARQAVARVKAVMDASSAQVPGPADYAALEADFVLPAGQGQAIYTLVQTANTRLNVAVLDDFVAKLG